MQPDTEAELRATVEALTQKNIELQKEIREMRGDLKPGVIVTITDNAVHRTQ